MSDIYSNAVDLTDVPREKWRTDYIGDGYRSCCYLRDHDNNGQIILFGYDKNDNRKTFICPWKSHIKFNVKYETNELDIYDRFVETRYFNNTSTRHNYLESVGDSIKVIECDRPEIEFLHAMFDDVALEHNFNRQPLRVFFYDIETEIGQTFEYPKTAGQRINAITIYDTLTEKYYVWTLSTQEIKITEHPLTDLPNDKFEIFYFQSDRESRMLEHFLSWWERNYPDVTCGYNSQAFDLPYIVRRIENVLGKEDAKRLSPIGRYRIKNNNLDNARANKQAEILAEIDGIFDADFLVLYRDKFKVKSPLDGGYSLNNVGEAEDLGQKVEYEGSLKEFYETDWCRFINYNIRDVDLLRRLEEKCKLVPLVRLITSAGLNNYNSIYSSISYLIGSLSQFSKTKMNRTMVSYSSKNDDKCGKYEGAYVFEPVPGIYKGGIGAVDFSSLYPNSIRSINLSPETTIGHLNSDWFGYTTDESPVFSDNNEFVLHNKNCELLKRVIKCMIKDLVAESGISLDDKDAIRRLAIENNIILTPSQRNITVTRDQVNALLKKYCIITRNNDIIVRHAFKRGVVAEWCAFFYNYRKSLKNEMARLDHMLYTNEIVGDDVVKTKTTIQNLNDGQQSTKIRLNSIYGCLGCSFSPIFDADLAQSITRQGKFCNRNASIYYKNMIKTSYHTNDDYIYTISGDTDSCEYHQRIYVIKNDNCMNG